MRIRTVFFGGLAVVSLAGALTLGRALPAAWARSSAEEGLRSFAPPDSRERPSPHDSSQAQVQAPAQSATPAAGQTPMSPPTTVPGQTSTAAPAGTPSAASSQEQAPTQDQAPTMTIRETVRRVIVDVTVLDGHGKPVHGLTQQDFSVTEDKQPQRVLSFDVYDFDKASLSRGANAPPLPPNVFVNVPNVPERGPLYVMLYDLVNTEIADQMTARGQILKFIRNKPEGTRFAIFVNSDELFLAQGFTSDKDLLYATLDAKHSRPHVPRIFLYGKNYGFGNPYTVLQVLTQIGRYLDGIPGRKNLIWVAGTFPTALFPAEGDPVDAQDQIKAETNALAQAQVAVFPVNVRGVVLNPEGALTGASPRGGAGGEAAGTQLGAGAPAVTTVTGSTGGPVGDASKIALSVGNQGGSSLAGDYRAQEALATATGGRAVLSDNDLSAALGEVTEEGGNYYTLTYAPPSRADDGKCHNIGVKLNKTEYRLAYRRYYCRVAMVADTAEPGGQRSKAGAVAIPLQAGDELQANMKWGAPMVHDLVFSAHVRTEGGVAMATAGQMQELQNQADYFRTNRKNKVAKPLPAVRVQNYVIDYRVLDPQLRGQETGNGKQATLEFTVAAFDADGNMLNGMVNDAVGQASTEAGANKSGLFLVRQSLEVPVNAVAIRVGVRDRSSDRIGTLEVPLPLATAVAH